MPQYKNKTEMFDDMTEALSNFVERWKDEVDNDLPIQGSDAVDYLVEFYHVAEAALNSKLKGE